MIAEYILHLEFHRGYRPRISLRRKPEAGDRVVDGGTPGTLVRCRECGEGFLHVPDLRAVPTIPVQAPVGDYWVYTDPLPKDPR